MNRKLTVCISLFLGGLLFSFDAFAAYDYYSVDFPGTSNSTAIHDLDGNRMVGIYTKGGQHGFLYDGSTWRTLDPPGSIQTSVYGIDGAKIVGNYNTSTGGSHGFMYDLVSDSYGDLDFPGAIGINLNGIDNGNIVGQYSKAGVTHGFLYDGTNWTTVDYPGAVQTTAQAISGDNIIVWYFDGSIWRSSLYSNGSFTAMPDYPGGHSLFATGIDGDNIVGVHYDNSTNRIYGFLYDGTNWTRLDYPGAIQNGVEAIDGDTIVGWYVMSESGGNHQHAFFATPVQSPPPQVPEPATMLLFGLGFLGAVSTRRRMR